MSYSDIIEFPTGGNNWTELNVEEMAWRGGLSVSFHWHWDKIVENDVVPVTVSGRDVHDFVVLWNELTGG